MYLHLRAHVKACDISGISQKIEHEKANAELWEFSYQEMTPQLARLDTSTDPPTGTKTGKIA